MAAKQLYLQFAKRHRNRSKAPFISFDFFVQETQKPCVYCGSAPLSTHKHQSVEGARYIYNGLDRIQCDGGYEADNVVPACGPCNVMRMSQPLDVFLDRVRRIAINRLNARFPDD
jgi:hypothetical protein